MAEQSSAWMAKTITTEELQANNEPARIVDSNHLRNGATLNGKGAGQTVTAAPCVMLLRNS